jgi:hypothetical protein
MGNYCADFVQIALGYLISWQSSFFRFVGLGYYVGHSAIRLQDPEFSEFYRHPGLTLSAVGI